MHRYMKRCIMLNTGDKKMRKTILFSTISAVISVFFAAAPLCAQNNPGYLGYTQSVDVTCSPQFFNLVAGGPALKPAFGLAYERSTKSRLSWRIGYSRINNSVTQKNLDYYSPYLEISDPNIPFDPSRESLTGSFDYSYKAFSLGAKFFKNSKGAVAPFGSYWGLELDYGTAVVTDDSRIVTKVDPNGWGDYQPVKYENDPWKKVKIVSLHLTMGKRRYFGTSGISCFYEAGIGYPMWQNANTYLLAGSGGIFNNHQDLIESSMVRHVANGGIVEFKIGFGYGIK
jgi:hypothetical protein